MPCVAVRYVFATRAIRKQERVASVNAKKAARLAKRQKVTPTITKKDLHATSNPQTMKTNEILRVPHGRKPSRAQLINAESQLGSQIFGPIPEGHRREFFHDKQNIWIWHEAWTDENAHSRQLTVRYEVRKTGVYKKISAGAYFKLQGAELDNFRKAANTYLRVVKKWLYNY